MILYLILGIIAMAVACALGFTLGILVVGASVTEVILNISITFLALVVVDALAALIVRGCYNLRGGVNPFNKIYKVHNWERKFYTKLGVKKWKDVIPEAGKSLVGFDKRNVAEMNNNEYIKKFMEESILAEIMHGISFIISVIMLFVFVRLALIVRLPLIICNMIYNLMPVIVQRYNRPKLMLVYERNKRLEQRKAQAENK